MKAARLIVAFALAWLLCAPESRADEFGNRAWGKSEYQSVITPDDEAQTLVRYQETPTGYGEIASGQEVWTKFDPLGLMFDDSTFDQDSGHMKNWKDLDKKTQDKISGEYGKDSNGKSQFPGGAAYDNNVKQYNSQLDKMKSTAFGSKEYEFLKNQTTVYGVTFVPTLGTSGSEGAHYQDSTKTFNFNPGDADMGTMAHEFMHGIQFANLGGASTLDRGAGRKAAGNGDFKDVYDDGDDNRPIDPGSPGDLHWMEAQAQRAMNIVSDEYGIKNSPGTGGPTTGYPYYRPSLETIRGPDPIGFYGTNSYGDGTQDHFTFQHPTGSYPFTDALNESNQRQGSSPSP